MQGDIGLKDSTDIHMEVSVFKALAFELSMLYTAIELETHPVSPPPTLSSPTFSPNSEFELLDPVHLVLVFAAYIRIPQCRNLPHSISYFVI